MKREDALIQMMLDLGHELVIDNFAGGGGASEGIYQALGRQPDIAINHDGPALAMHAANHPTTRHYREDVFDVHPGLVTGQRPIGLAWFSPDCKHHSKAKGGKPREKGIRGLAWVTLKWGAFQAPRCIGLENVEEFREWGPLDDEGRVIKSEKGRTFDAFIAALTTGVDRDHPDVPEIYEALGSDFPMERLYQGLGYKVEWRILYACDYGTPTIRRRLFMFARRDGKPIRWPSPTHGDPKARGFDRSGLLPYRTAAECIDWSIPVRSIFNRTKPLADKTMARIAKGVMKYIIDNPEPFIVPGDAAPFLTEHANGSTQRVFDINEPLRTQCAEVKGGHFALVSAMLMKYNGREIGPDAPWPTDAQAANDDAMVASTMIKLRGTSVAADVAEPLHTVSAGGNHHAEVRAFLIKYYSTGGQDQSLDDPMHTIPTKDRIALVMVRGEPYAIVDIGMRMLTPRELARAQGFPESYVLEAIYNGKTLTNAEQIRMIGNSVCPPVARALIEANFRHERVWRMAA
jgi:DNA (cytosine-5)-methyltransferase 1